MNNGYYQDPNTGQVVFVGNAELNPQLTQGKIFIGETLPPNLQGGQLPQGATGANAQGVPGNWEVNPTTGIVEFIPLGGGGGGGSGTGSAGQQQGQQQGSFNVATSPITQNPLYVQTQDQINALKLQMDAASLAQINAIESTYNAFIEQQKRINRGLEGSLQQSLIQGGSQKYAQLSSAGIAATQMSFGLSQIAEWEGKKQNAIAQAKLAQGQNNFKLLELETENIKTFQAEKEKAMKELADKMVKQNETIKKESAIYDVIKQYGVSDRIGIFEKLKELGDGSVTTEDINKFLDNLTPKQSKDETKYAYKFSNEDVGKLISAGIGSGEDIQALQDVINKNGLYGKVKELGEKSLAETLDKKQFSAIRDILYPPPKDKKTDKLPVTADLGTQQIRFARLAFGSGRALSDADRDFAVEIVNSAIEGGMSLNEFTSKGIYDLLDKMSGYTVNRNKPLAEGLRTILLNLPDEKGFTDYPVDKIARLINQKSDLEAIRFTEGLALNTAREIYARDAQDFIPENDIGYVGNKVNEIDKLLGQGWSNEVGAFTGSFSGWISKKFGIGQAAKIKAKITSLTADMVNKRAGSALTEEEWKRLISANVPSLSDSGKTVKDKLQELIDDNLLKHNSLRELVSLPRLSWEQIKTPELRVPLYLSRSALELDDFLGSFDADVKNYSPTVWE